MKLYEYQARELLQQYCIDVPKGELASTPEQAAESVAAFSGKAMIKGQVLTGGRGKAGAVRAVSSKEEAKSVAREILAVSVKDFSIQQLLITEMLDIQVEYYVAITIDREAKSVVLIISSVGGVDIEEVAVREREKIRHFVMADVQGSDSMETLEKWLSVSFPDPALRAQAFQIAKNMYRLFREKDCSLVEINPLAQTAQNQLVAADAKIVFDDNGFEKHPDIAQFSNPEEYTTDELEARAAGLSFVSLSGEIGCMVNGAGLAMATMDGIKLAGGSPANFLDVGGSSNPQKVLDAMRILLRNKQLKVILINIFGGITRCDDIAQGILWAREKLGITVPIIIRLIGTNDQRGRNMLNEAGLIVTDCMTDAIQDAVNCAQKGSK
ncbi:MAG: ADP-forming succinate--CoA ligase subunit beta [Planctomycetes bacterium]|nr:ADP-forming succinate--CoA ligase subunit beta [Planctomycetota bacterium]